MTTKNLAPRCLNLVNDTSLHRLKDDRVNVIGSDGSMLTTILREDWENIAKFFTRISHKGALL